MAGFEFSKDAYYIVRAYSAGVFAGNIVEKSDNGRHVRMKNARRLWYWNGAASLSQLAIDGVKRPEDCKFPAPLDEVELTEVIEIIRATEAAKKSVEEVPIWRV